MTRRGFLYKLGTICVAAIFTSKLVIEEVKQERGILWFLHQWEKQNNVIQVPTHYGIITLIKHPLFEQD